MYPIIDIKRLHFRRLAVNFTISKFKLCFAAYFSVSSEKIENRALQLMVLTISHYPLPGASAKLSLGVNSHWRPMLDFLMIKYSAFTAIKRL